MRKIWKYKLQEETHNILKLPRGSRFLSVVEQNDHPVLYALVNPEEEEVESWGISVIGTGQPVQDSIEESWEFLGTVAMPISMFVWHCWRLKLNQKALPNK